MTTTKSNDILLGKCTINLCGLVEGTVTRLRMELTDEASGRSMGAQLELEIVIHGFGRRKNITIEREDSRNQQLTSNQNGTSETTVVATMTAIKTEKLQTTSSPLSSPTGVATPAVTNNKYQKMKPIGQGTEAKIFLGVDQSDGQQRKVAIKRLVFHCQHELEKARREALPIMELNHPHIVKYDDIYEENIASSGSGGGASSTEQAEQVQMTALCFVMQYFENGDLRRYLKMRKTKGGRPHFERVVKYSLQLADAVKYLHSCRVMHRDIKPENILMSHDYNSVHLGDFGFKKQMDESLANTVLGSFGFLAPEVASMQQYSWKADIYSLGCVMYEMVTLELGVNHNFQAISSGESYFRSVEDKMDGAYGNSALSQLVVSMLRIAPQDRPTASEVVSRLKSILLEHLAQHDNAPRSPATPSEAK